MLEPLLVKSDDWIYEGEIRCVYTKNKPNSRIHDIEDQDGIKTLLDMPKPKKIYIGCNALPDEASRFLSDNNNENSGFFIDIAKAISEEPKVGSHNNVAYAGTPTSLDASGLLK